MKSNKVFKDGTTEFDWLIFAQSYFYIARLACQELLDRREEKHNRSLDDNIKLSYKTSNLYVAILFNVKHGVEVFIKFLSILDFGEYEEGHNIHDLFLRFRKKVSGKLEKEDLDKMEELIQHFYKLEFLKPKIKEFYEISDIQNDIFRYPDNHAKIQVRWELIIDMFNERDIAEIKYNLDKFLKLLNKSGFKLEN